MAEAGDKCHSCGASALATDGTCSRCGWNGKRGQRRCVKCGSLVEGDYDVEKLKVPGAVVMALAVVGGFVGGFLGSLALGLAMGAVGSAVMALTFRYRCQDCDAMPPERLLLEGERNDIRDRRATFFMRAGLMGAGSVIVAAFWIAVLLARHGRK